MDLGVATFPASYSLPVVDLARAVEERGFESLSVPEHTHIPMARRSAWPGQGPLPEERGRPAPSVTVFAGRADGAVLDHYAAAGVDRCLFMLAAGPAAAALAELDRYRTVAEPWIAVAEPA